MSIYVFICIIILIGLFLEIAITPRRGPTIQPPPDGPPPDDPPSEPPAAGMR